MNEAIGVHIVPERGSDASNSHSSAATGVDRELSPIEMTELVIVVRGGGAELPPPGTVFSRAVGKTLEDAAAFVPHGKIRFTTIGTIQAGGGSVTLKPEVTRSGRINERHVDVIEGSSPSAFSDAIPNPIPKADRIQ